MISKKNLIDRFTRIDDLMEEMLPILKKLQLGDIAVHMPEGPEGEDIFLRMLEIYEKRLDDDYEILFFTYPNTGGRISVAAGTTVLDYWGGTVKSPAGTITKMTTNLPAMKKEFLRSFSINADEEIVIQMDDKDKMIAKADTWFIMTYQQFQKCSITCTKATDIFCFACTNPKHAMEMQGETTVSIGREERNQLKTDKDIRYTNALAQYESQVENITGLNADEITITGIAIAAQQALDLRLWLFETHDFQAADMDDDEFIEFVDIDLATDGTQYKNTGIYYYALTGLNIDYEDLSGTKCIHAALENIGALGKLAAGSGGNLWVKFSYIPRT